MKNKNLTLKAQKRELLKRKVKTLRREGLLPANVYGKNVKSTAIQLPLVDFKKLYEEAGETSLIDLDLGKTKKTVLISDVQMNPTTDEPIHVDFKEVNLKEKVTATVPVVLEGESSAEKSGLGTVVQQISELDVEALPQDLPEELVASIDALSEVDDAVHVKDLKYDKAKVEVHADPEELVAKVEPPQKEEETVIPSASEGAEETEEEGETAPAEEAPTE